MKTDGRSGCAPFRKLAQDYLENLLISADVQLLDAHLAECSECGREMEELRRLHNLLETTSFLEELPSGFTQKVVARVKADAITAQEITAIPERRRISLKAAAGAAAVALGGIAFAVWAAAAAGFGYYGEGAYSFFDMVYITSFFDLLWSFSESLYGGFGAASGIAGLSATGFVVLIAILAAIAVTLNVLVLSRLKPTRINSGK